MTPRYDQCPTTTTYTYECGTGRLIKISHEPVPHRGPTVETEIRISAAGAGASRCTWVFQVPDGVQCAVDERTGRAIIGSAEGYLSLADSACRLTEFIDGTGAKTTFEYLAEGDLVRVTEPSFRTRTFANDPDRRLWPVVDSETGRVSYVYQPFLPVCDDEGEPAEEVPPT